MEEAAALELAFDQLLNYVQLWRAHSEVAGTEDAQRASAELKAHVLACYTFIVKEAGMGGAEEAFQRLDGIAALVQAQGIAAAVATAAANMQQEGEGAAAK